VFFSSERVRSVENKTENIRDKRKIGRKEKLAVLASSLNFDYAAA